jgi:glycosyltransferase involved in cell wall biosynthesis
VGGRRLAQPGDPGAGGLNATTTGHIVVVTGEVLAPRLAGPAIRAREFARALAGEHSVTLVTTASCDLADDAFECRHADGDELGVLGMAADVVIVQGDALRRAPGLREAPVVVVDLYAPFQLEALEQSRGFDRSRRRAAVALGLDVVNEQLRRGDFFLCAHERQRDFWIGQLTAVGRVNEAVYDASPGLEDLVAVVPFGVPDVAPTRTGPGVRDEIPGIDAYDEVLLWGGGIYDWFDPQTLIRAVDQLKGRRPRIRLYFAGARHPNPAVAETAAARAARRLSDELGLTDRHVFFGDWLAYDDRVNVLLDADVAVSAHHDHIEARYSFRTRALDALWAGLPMVSTRGDALADRIAAAGAGVDVPPGDATELADAIDGFLGDRAARDVAAKAARALAADLRWSITLRPLVEFCAAPRRSPDRGDPDIAAAIARGGDLASDGPLRSAVRHVRRGEWDTLREKVRRRVIRRT